MTISAWLFWFKKSSTPITPSSFTQPTHLLEIHQRFTPRYKILISPSFQPLKPCQLVLLPTSPGYCFSDSGCKRPWWNSCRSISRSVSEFHLQEKQPWFTSGTKMLTTGVSSVKTVNKILSSPFQLMKFKTLFQVLGYPSKPIGLFIRRSIIFRSDSNGEDLEGYAGAGLYDR